MFWLEPGAACHLRHFTEVMREASLYNLPNRASVVMYVRIRIAEVNCIHAGHVGGGFSMRYPAGAPQIRNRPTTSKCEDPENLPGPWRHAGGTKCDALSHAHSACGGLQFGPLNAQNSRVFVKF